jgi:hypothetical protein
LRPPRVVSWARYRKVGGIGQPLQEVAKGVAGQRTGESEQTVVVGRRLDLRNGKPYPAEVYPPAKCMLASDIGKVVGDLLGGRYGVSHVISANGSKARALRKID